jgi:general secretion pathway protein E
MNAHLKHKSLAKSPHVGPVDWRRLVEWLQADGVISD